MIRLYNTRTRKVEELGSRPRLAPETTASGAESDQNDLGLRVYCCGPTTYDVSHAGHGRTAMLPDLLVRHLRASGHKVTYARNITDVEDKIVKRSIERGEHPLALSARFAEMYIEDLATLGCVPPDFQPRVSECIPAIVTLIEKLIANGAAYTSKGLAGDDVWFSIAAFPTYGCLSRRPLDELRAGEGLEERGKVAKEGKREPLDFALWKSVAEGEWGFPSPWGTGRPGWHIECSAMVEQYLGFGIDIHAGGMDLIFPHHENEVAQSEAAHPGEGCFSDIWMHGGFLNVDKEKMAKSLGNFVTMRDCYARNDGEALRYFLLSAHYRVPIEFDTHKFDDGRVAFPGLDEAERRVDYFYTTLERVSELATGEPTPAPVKELDALAKVIRGARQRVSDALDDDLNAPVALAVVNDLVKATNDLVDLAQKRKKDPKLVGAAVALAVEAKGALVSSGEVLGLLLSEPAAYRARTQEKRLRVRSLSKESIEGTIQARRAARDAKDFARGDALRDELLALGVEIFDTQEGTTWRIKA
jgi:cysteinyl-tRNA synthetase